MKKRVAVLAVIALVVVLIGGATALILRPVPHRASTPTHALTSTVVSKPTITVTISVPVGTPTPAPTAPKWYPHLGDTFTQWTLALGQPVAVMKAGAEDYEWFDDYDGLEIYTNGPTPRVSSTRVFSIIIRNSTPQPWDAGSEVAITQWFQPVDSTADCSKCGARGPEAWLYSLALKSEIPTSGGYFVVLYQDNVISLTIGVPGA